MGVYQWYTPNLFASICRTLLHQSIENNNVELKNESKMYIDNENFDKWMERLSKKLSEIGQDLKSLINTDNVLDENDKILDNQDLAFLLKVSFRTLQRYRASGKLPYFTISHKTYYRSADIRAFVQENADSTTYERFKKENQFDKQYEAKQGE